MKKILSICALLFVVSIAACQNPFNSSRQEQDEIPYGMGSFTFLIQGLSSRTILPEIPVFQAFELVFTGPRNVTVRRDISNLSSPVHLVPGTYNLTITAFMDLERQIPTARAEVQDLRIEAGRGITHTISLRPLSPDGTGLGTFRWDISIPDGITDARMVIIPLIGDNTDELEFRFFGAGGDIPLSYSVTLATGFYSVLFTFVKPGYQTLEWLEILHVYQGLVSFYAQEFTTEFFNDNNHTVTFVFNDDRTDNAKQNYIHGQLVSPPAAPAPPGQRLRFGGWFVNANFSERWNPAEPVIRSRTLYLRWLSETCSDVEIVGTFRGDVTMHNFFDVGEVIVQLFADGTARIQATSFPGFTILANYSHRFGTLQLSNIVLHTSDMGRQAVERLIGDYLPGQIPLPTRQWCMDDGIVLSGGILTGTLYSTENFNFSPEIIFTGVTLHIEYPNASQSGRYVLTAVQFLDIAKPPVTLIGTLQGNRASKRAYVLNDFTQSRVMITSYLFHSINDLNTSIGLVANQPALLMAGSHIAETTANPWQPPAVFTLSSGVESQFTIRFPHRMNIRMNHGNFTISNPVVSWDPIPGANGYFVMGLVQNRDFNPPVNNNLFAPVFYHHTMETTVTINSLPVINPGEFIRVEVFALDNSGFLDTENRTGAILMDTLTIVR